MFFQKINVFFLCLIVLFAIGCDKMEDEILDGTQPNTGIEDSVSVTPGEIPPDDTRLTGAVVIADGPENAADKWVNNDYMLESAMIVEDTLTINVAYGGGCEDHEFTLIASEAFMESDPVQLSVSIVHNANLDPCERWVEEAYHFDLTPIKTMYQQAYQQDAGTIVLNLANLPEGAPALIYEFAE